MRRFLAGSTIFVVLLLSACSGDAFAPRVDMDDATELTGTWTGSYTCSQGVTGVWLDLVGYASGRVEGTFRFFPVASHPGVATGSFRMLGSLAQAGGVVLAGGAWIERPPGYGTVDLEGRVDSTGALFTGDVISSSLDSSCGTFHMSKE